jgi:LPPG:FO 2-phospho-L-lactate transferase
MAGVVALAGGVGGAKLAFGLDRALVVAGGGPAVAASPARRRERSDPSGASAGAGGGAVRPGLTVVVNTGDDLEVHGLHVSPDVDTVMYTLAGIADRERGWGLADETWRAMTLLERYGAETWFRLGDGDLATHLWRTSRLAEGASLSMITNELASALGVASALLPMSDDEVRTRLRTADGWLDFQHWFVRRRQADRVTEIRFEGIEGSHPAPGVLEAIDAAGLVVVCPSNPYVSIAPILAVPGIREALLAAAAPVLAVTPIVAGRALRGPADRMLEWLGSEATSAGVAQLYAERYPGLLDGFVVDRVDAALEPRIAALGLTVLVADTVMESDGERIGLARVVLDWGGTLPRRA